jgi:hypothetical protein
VTANQNSIRRLLVRHRVFGYHGTTQAAAKAILSDPTNFILSAGAGDWLGAGIYFFENSYQKGLEWARRSAGKTRPPSLRQQEAVLGCEIDLTNCLDFCDPTQTAEFRNWVDVHINTPDLDMQHAPRLLSAKAREFSISDYPYRHAKNSDRYKFQYKINVLDKGVIDAFLATMRPAKRFTSVRAPFNSGRQLFPNSYLFHNSQIQIAVRDPARAIRNLQIVDGPMGRRRPT